MTVLSAALKYLSAGLCVIPIKPDWNPESEKFEKKPYIKWTDYQSRLSTEEEVRSWWSKWPNAMIGLVTGKISNLYAIDCDSEEAYQKIQELLPETFLTTTTVSPRGGHHLWVKCQNGNALRTVAGVLSNVDTRGDGGYIIAPPSVNSKNGSYQWLEGLGFDEVAPQELPYTIISTLRGGVIGGENGEAYKNGKCRFGTEYYKDYTILQEGHRDQDLFEIGMALADGRYKRDRIAQVLEVLARNCEPPFPEKELEQKISSVFGRISVKDRNLADEVREWCLLQEGYMNTTLIRQDLHITTKNDIKNLSVILNRLESEGIIEKYGDKRGSYRVKSKNDKLEMKFIEEEIPEFDIRLPFGLNQILSLYPKNIIIIAGSKSSGKTTLMMKIALANQDRFPVVYMNSEMGDEEWSVRLKKLGITKRDDQRFKALGVHNNFHDMIDEGKKLYLIDYLEIHDNFYEIAKPIRKIHEALKDGICIIGVQKKQGQTMARGGEFSMEKSRLYLSLDYLNDQRCTKMTIVDAKSPKVQETPRGWSKRIKIIDGSKMESLDKDWVL